MKYQETIAYLFSQLPMYQRIGAAAFHYKPDKTLAILKILDNPHQNLRFIHIAGTNGKGSVSHLLASVLQEAGYRTGLYTSPHLVDFRERIRINGQMIDKEEVVKFVQKYKNQLSSLQCSFFEYSFAMAMYHFAKQKVDIVVLETGMGGRLDSTNVVQPGLCIITNIGLDHTQFLGNTMLEIAGEKAGIIKQGIPVIIGETQRDLEDFFRQKASAKNSEIIFADQQQLLRECNLSMENEVPLLKCVVKWNREKLPVRTPLAGQYQIKNIQTVLASVNKLTENGYKISQKHFAAGLKNVIKNTHLSGRWQILKRQPLVICDTGHNREGLSYVVEQLCSLRRKVHFVFGTMKDKNHSEIFAILPKEARYYFCAPDVPRAMNVTGLQKEAKEFQRSGEAFPSVASACETALSQAKDEDVVFVGGSTFVVAEALVFFGVEG